VSTFRTTGSWGKAAMLLGKMSDPARWKVAKRKAILKESHRLRKLMIEAFQKGGPSGKRWPRLSVFTQLVSRAMGKGDRKPLMDSGNLRNSHSVVEESDNIIFVGVHRTAKRKVKSKKSKKGSDDLVQIASLMEHGSKPIYIRVTPKMRNFFLWLHKKTKGQIKPLRKNTVGIIVRIPPRPWMGPIWEAEADSAAKNIVNDTIKNMNLPGFSRVI